jgi:hypothetical protein
MDFPKVSPQEFQVEDSAFLLRRITSRVPVLSARQNEHLRSIWCVADEDCRQASLHVFTGAPLHALSHYWPSIIRSAAQIKPTGVNQVKPSVNPESPRRFCRKASVFFCITKISFRIASFFTVRSFVLF